MKEDSEWIHRPQEKLKNHKNKQTELEIIQQYSQDCPKCFTDGMFFSYVLKF